MNWIYSRRRSINLLKENIKREKERKREKRRQRRNEIQEQITANTLIPIISFLKNREVLTLPPELQQDINKFRIDGFARKYFITHKKGIFRRKVPVEKMLIFQKVTSGHREKK